MQGLEKLHDLVYNQDINIYNFHFSIDKKAMCHHVENYKSIVLDKPAIKSTAEEKALLAEELGHYETGSLYLLKATYNSPICLSNIIWCEGKAKRWAIEKLVPKELLNNAIKVGIKEVWELAEYFNVTEDFMSMSVEYYKGIA